MRPSTIYILSLLWYNLITMKLVIVRHGETEENVKKILTGHSEGRLTKLGILQAEVLANKLKHYKFSQIYSSDLGRSIDTARIIQKYFPNIRISKDKNLREFDFGHLQGKLKNAVLMELNILLQNKDKQTIGGESLNGLSSRLKKLINKLYMEHKNDVILCVSHTNVIKSLISIYKDLDMKIVWKKYHIENTGQLILDIGGISKGRILKMIDVTIDK